MISNKNKVVCTLLGIAIIMALVTCSISVVKLIVGISYTEATRFGQVGIWILILLVISIVVELSPDK